MTPLERRLQTVQRKGTKAVRELRHFAADAALHWVLSHKSRVAQFRRTVRNTPAEDALDSMLAVIRSEATTRAPARKPARKTARRRA